jgi:hypothetical protein
MPERAVHGSVFFAKFHSAILCQAFAAMATSNPVATTQARTWDGAENGEFVPCNRQLQNALSG